jgi:hypothetical protein
MMLLTPVNLPNAMLLPALAARASDDMQIYSDRLNNLTESN